jgi:hypothetical protein
VECTPKSVDSGKGMAEVARMYQLSPQAVGDLEKRVASQRRTGVSRQGCAALLFSFFGKDGLYAGPSFPLPCAGRAAFFQKR